jgi:hypothetical protein
MSKKRTKYTSTFKTKLVALLAQPADTPFKMIASCNRETQVTFLCTGAPSGYLKSHFYILGLPRGTASNISIHWGSLGVPQITFLYTGAPSGRGTLSHISIDWGSHIAVVSELEPCVQCCGE